MESEINEMKKWIVFAALLCVSIPNAFAQGTSNAAAPNPITVSPWGVLFTIDPAYTAPGTIEFETDTTYGDKFLAAPMALRFTPDTKNRFFRTTEFAVISGANSGLN